MSGFALAAKERLKSVNDALAAARLEQQAAHQAYTEMEGDASDPTFVAAYNAAVDAAKAKDAEVDNLVSMAANLSGSIAHATPRSTGTTPVEILASHPGMDGFKARVQSHVAAEIVSRDEAVRRFSAGLPMFAAGATAESLTAIDQRLYPPVQIPVRQPGLLDLIQIGSTDSDTVKYGVQTARTSAAASRARKAATSEATYTWSTQSVTVESVGHHVKAPIETVNDQAQLRTLLDGQLSDDLVLKVDDLIYQGAGTGTDFEGLKTAVVAAGYTYDRDSTNDGVIDAVRKGITKVQQQVFGNPTGLAMSPATWERCELERSTSTAKSGNYLIRGADASIASGAPYALFGLPVVVSALFADNEILVGNFRRGATLWLRQGVSVEMTNSNENDFLTGLIAIRATFRAAFKTVEPKAFSLVTL